MTPDLRPRALAWHDAVPALGLLVIGLFGTQPAGDNQPHWTNQPDHLAYALVIIAATSLLIRRIAPMVMLALCGSAITIYLALGYPFGPILLTAPFAVYAVASQVPARRALFAAGALFVAVFTVALIRLIGRDDGSVVTAILAFGLAWLAVIAGPAAVGIAMKVRRESEAGVKAAQARRAVSEERLRMAQELHDVVGHGLAVIAMQAGVALHVLDRNPDKARESLEAIRATSRESLDGLRAELDVWRSPDDLAAPRRPAPGLADLPVLVERMRAGGVGVELRMSELDGVPGDVDVAAYRILQESLTNVLRHAGAAAAAVEVRREDDVLALAVTDRGSGSPPDPDHGDGTGIRGMRARAEALGGTLEAGPRPDGGFAVHARLPLPDLSGSGA
ncbi:MAG TPA: sensor histidine kinase [Jiangellaceae bacterium]